MNQAQQGNATGLFALKDCAPIAIATGRRAFQLTELRDILVSIGADSIYFHFWGGLLEPRFEEREYNNDFASWVWHGLHDAPLAERLAALDPTAYANLEDLRQELLSVIEARLDESEYLHWLHAILPFSFIRSQLVVFDTQKRVAQPQELAELMPHLSITSVFYHFIDARRRSADGSDDFRVWLQGFGDRYEDLCARLAAVDPYFETLTELRAQLAELFAAQFAGGDDAKPA